MTRTVIELFAGAGGAALGLRRAGYRSLVAVEWDADAAATLKAAGFPAHHGDVRDVDAWLPSERADLWWASPPCQGWSTAGKGKGADDPRNGWPWVMDALDAAAVRGLRPTWILAENVSGMLHHDAACRGEKSCAGKCKRSYLDGFIMPALRARFAWADWKLLDAADYGVPQNRQRVIFAAGPMPIRWPEPTHSGEALAVAKSESGGYWRTLTAPAADVRVVGGGSHPHGPDREHERRLRDLTDDVATCVTAEQIGNYRPWVEVPCSSLAQSVRPVRFDRPAGTVSGVGDSTGGHRAPWLTSADHAPCAPTAREARWLRVPPAKRGHRYALQPWRTVRQALALTCACVGSGLKGSERGADEPAPVLRDGNGTSGIWLAGTEPELLDRPAVAVCATEGKGARHQGNATVGRSPMRASDQLWRATGRRRLTVAEGAVLQAFPADHPFAGTKTAKYRQVGNAVPPPLAEVVARAVVDAATAATQEAAHITGSPRQMDLPLRVSPAATATPSACHAWPLTP